MIQDYSSNSIGTDADKKSSEFPGKGQEGVLAGTESGDSEHNHAHSVRRGYSGDPGLPTQIADSKKAGRSTRAAFIHRTVELL